ncbi:MAG: DUF1295 domain-containing protein [Kofleriaceae bacterium]
MTAALHGVALAWAIAAGLQLVLWLVSQRTGNAAIVDVGWAGSFSLVVAALAATTDQPTAQVIAPTVLVAAWSLRLAAYLVARGAATGAEEGRYQELRRKWSPHAGRAFFVFFQAQAALTAILSIGFVWAFVAPARGGTAGTVLLVLGVAASAVGLVGETVADAQLAAWKRDPSHRGQVCDVGLWSWSRHPNYFFEVLVWTGHALYASAFVHGSLAFAAPTILLASIWWVTGIPATEAQALRSKGEAYRRYQARTSAFIPWPPRRREVP